MQEDQSSNIYIISIILYFLIAFVILLNAYKLLDFIAFYFYKKPFLIHFPVFLKEFKNNVNKTVIEGNFPVYRYLSPIKQKIFNHRVVKFIEWKEFVGMDGMEVTEEMKVQVASCAVFLSFGMRYYDIPAIDTIIIYPDVYYSNLSDAYHKGEFNPMQRAIVLSWKHFLIGFEDSDDGINLGLHEFSHALFFSNFRESNTSADIFQDGLESLQQIYMNESKLEDLKNIGFLRPYGYNNFMEFFSVCVEMLVEKPIAFKQYHNELYMVIIRMLNFSFIEKKGR
ncbi:zinc-dependent peptidase [Neptunitalea lumnitzerae]|nr:zinc-dependent peptidase [Neptunitalea sp. Y10]